MRPLVPFGPQVTGQRHPFVGHYQVGATADGRIVAAKVELYSNGGFSLDLSGAVMDRALFHLDNAYNIPIVDFRGEGLPGGIWTNSFVHDDSRRW